MEELKLSDWTDRFANEVFTFNYRLHYDFKTSNFQLDI